MAEAANYLEVPGGGGSDANSSILTATSSFSSTLSPSDLDTESITSFFPERGITLGSLIGIARGVGALQDGDPSSLPRASAANRANCRAGSMLGGSTASSQGISCSHMSRICENINLWSLLPCGTCIYANNKGVGNGFCRADKGDSCVVPSETGLLSSSLARFLMAERDADRDAERLNNEAKVYINIMYEEGHRAEDAAVNPLFDLDASPADVGSSGSMSSGEMQSPGWLCTQSPRTCQEGGVMLSSLCTDNETCMVHGGRMAKATSMPPHVEAVPGRTPSVPANKEQKGPDVWDLGCVSYMCTRCRF